MRVGVIGTGLMGASVALAARRRGDTVVGWDVDPDALAAAVAREALDAASSLEEAVRDADLVVVAAPIAALPAQVEAGLAAPRQATGTDGGSAKATRGPAPAAGSLRDSGGAGGGTPRFGVGFFPDTARGFRGPLAERRRRIEQVESALEQGDAGFLARWIGEASTNRRRMLEREYPDPGALQRLRVHISDRPGVLAAITQALGAERINIEDFELHHMSPERGGTLQMLVEGEGEAQRAAALLEGQGYSVVVSPVLEEEQVVE